MQIQPAPLTSRLLPPLLPPAVVLLVALILLSRLGGQDGTVTGEGGTDALVRALPYATYGLAATAAILAISFNRSRVFFSVAVVALAHWALLADWGEQEQGLASLIHGSVCVLVPFDLLLFSVFRERGFLTRLGLLRVAFVGAQVVLVGMMHRNPGSADWLYAELLPMDSLRITPIPPTGLLAFLLAAAGLVARLALSGSRLDAGCLGALGGTAAAFHFAGQEGPIRLFLAAAVLILLVAVLQDSYGKAYIDELTGIPGRRALEEALLRLPRSYAIAMVDVDHFKKFNDKYGHDVGDQVLRRVAGHLNAVGGGGRAFRYGGEEFVLLFAGSDPASVEGDVEALREKVATTPFALRSDDRPSRKPEKPGKGRKNPKQVRITISIGVAGRGEAATDAHAVIEAADRALYKAKKRGRNRVVLG